MFPAVLWAFEVDDFLNNPLICFSNKVLGEVPFEQNIDSITGGLNLLLNFRR